MKAHYEKVLIEEKNRLLEELKGLGKFDEETGDWQVQSNVDDNQADMNDNADRFEDYEEKSSLTIPLEKRLNEVEGALTRILEGSFGKCVVCQHEIEKERLDANPAAETCLKHMK